MHLPQFERHAVSLDGVDDLVAGVGQGRAAGLPRLPGVEGLDRPLGVILAEGSPQRLLDQVDHRPGQIEADEHGDRQPKRPANQTDPQLLQMLAERHRRALKQILVGSSRHGVMGPVFR
jgi:hypothetical protein